MIETYVATHIVMSNLDPRQGLAGIAMVSVVEGKPYAYGSRINDVTPLAANFHAVELALRRAKGRALRFMVPAPGFLISGVDVGPLLFGAIWDDQQRVWLDVDFTLQHSAAELYQRLSGTGCLFARAEPNEWMSQAGQLARRLQGGHAG